MTATFIDPFLSSVAPSLLIPRSGVERLRISLESERHSRRRGPTTGAIGWAVIAQPTPEQNSLPLSRRRTARTRSVWLDIGLRAEDRSQIPWTDLAQLQRHRYRSGDHRDGLLLDIRQHALLMPIVRIVPDYSVKWPLKNECEYDFDGAIRARLSAGLVEEVLALQHYWDDEIAVGDPGDPDPTPPDLAREWERRLEHVRTRLQVELGAEYDVQ